MRPSAGTTSPASSNTTSPGTSSTDSISSTRPARRTRACGTCSCASASTLARALSSWREPMTTLNVTSSATKMPVATCPMARLATATITSMMFIGFDSWPQRDRPEARRRLGRQLVRPVLRRAAARPRRRRAPNRDRPLAHGAASPADIPCHTTTFSARGQLCLARLVEVRVQFCSLRLLGLTRAGVEEHRLSGSEARVLARSCVAVCVLETGDAESRSTPPGMKERRPKAVIRATRTPGEQDREHERDDGDDHVTRGPRSLELPAVDQPPPHPKSASCRPSPGLPGQPRWVQTWGNISCGYPSELGEPGSRPRPRHRPRWLTAPGGDSSSHQSLLDPASGSSGWGGAGSAAGRRARSAPAVCAVTACWTPSWIRLLPSPRACRHGRIGSRTMSGGPMESTPAPHQRWRHAVHVTQ